MRTVTCSTSARSAGSCNPRLQLAQEFVLLQRLHVEQHDRPIAKQNRRPAAAHAQHQRPAAQPLRRAQRPQVDPLADQQGPRGEFAGFGLRSGVVMDAFA